MRSFFSVGLSFFLMTFLQSPVLAAPKDSPPLRPWVEVKVNSHLPHFELIGGGGKIGLQLGRIGFDVMGQGLSGAFGRLYSSPDYGDLRVAGDWDSGKNFDSELNRTRLATETWSGFLFGLGVRIETKLLGFILEHFEEYGRIGLNYGFFKDHENLLNFSGFLPGIEAGVLYYLDSKRSFALDLGVSWQWGAVLREGSGSEQMRRLPLQFWTTQFGVRFVFL
jgi:hypothetical protein